MRDWCIVLGTDCFSELDSSREIHSFITDIKIFKENPQQQMINITYHLSTKQIMSEAENNISEIVKVKMEEPSEIFNEIDIDKLGNEKCEVTVKEEEEESKPASLRENRLTNIIDQLRCQNKLKGT